MLANMPITYPIVFNVNGRLSQILKLSAAAVTLGLAWTFHQPLFDMISPALALSLTATVIGSQISFMLARRAGRPLIERLAPVELLDKWSAISAEKGLVFFLFAFMLPVFPADIMNFIAGFSALSPRRFFIANLFGRLPGVVLLTAVGSYGLSIPPIAWIGVAIVGAITFIGLRAFFANKK